MQMDDSKHKVYIHDIDAELSETDSEKDLVFLPDIEKRLTKVPKSVLLHADAVPANMEMVLYNVPSSLVIPEERDSVRKAIIEARGRAQEKAMQEAREKGTREDSRDANNYANRISMQQPVNYENDGEAMEID